jgi:DNA polymerase-3 subunit beta
MRLTIEQSLLAGALARGAVVAPKTHNIPILTHVRLTAGADGQLAVASSDLERFAEAYISATVEAPGQITVPGQAFVTLINKHPKNGTISLELEGATLVVKCGRSKVKLPILSVEDFPAWADEPAAAEFVISGQAFSRAVNRVRFAAASDIARPMLQGVALHATEDALRFVATDGNRLAISAMPLPEGAEAMTDVLIMPTQTLDVALGIFKGLDEVHVAFTSRAVNLTSDGLRLSSKLIEGPFPDYMRVVPTEGFGNLIQFKRADFVDCLERANVLVGEGAYSSIVATPTDGSLKLQSQNQKGGEAQEELSAVIAPGFKKFGFSPRFAAQFLASLSVDELCIEQGDPNGPHRIVSPEAPDFTGVLMPMRVAA